MIKELLHQKDITLLNVHTLNYWGVEYIKKMTDLEKLDKFTSVVEDFNTPMSLIDRKLNRL